MLAHSHTVGFDAGLSRYGIKLAGAATPLLEAGAKSFGQKAMGWGRSAGNWLLDGAVGKMRNPAEAAGHLMSGDAFRPGGAVREFMWPTIHPEDKMFSRGGKWLWRGLGVGMPALHVGGALLGQGDPNQGWLSNVLGAAGSEAGAAIGFPMAGALGAPILGRAGGALGRGIGHALGSRPHPMMHPQQQMQPLEGYGTQYQPMTGGY